MKTLLILIVLIISSAIFSWGFSGKELNYFRTECSIKQIETDTLISYFSLPKERTIKNAFFFTFSNDSNLISLEFSPNVNMSGQN